MKSPNPERFMRHAPADDKGPVEKIDMGPEDHEYLKKLESSLRSGKMQYKERVQSKARTNRTVRQEAEEEVVIRGAASDIDKASIPLPGKEMRAKASAAPRPANRPVTQGTDGSFPVGTILRFEDNALGVFKDAKKDKDYELVYRLLTDGTVRPQGMALESYDVKVLGKLPPEFVHRLQRRLTWNRDEIIFHLEHFDYCELVPEPDASIDTTDEEFEGEESQPSQNPLTKGRLLTLSFGPNQKWQAVYWGDDDLGPLVAHKTAENWALMHLDLDRFADTMEFGTIAPEQMLAEIEAELALV